MVEIPQWSVTVDGERDGDTAAGGGGAPNGLQPLVWSSSPAVSLITHGHTDHLRGILGNQRQALTQRCASPSAVHDERCAAAALVSEAGTPRRPGVTILHSTTLLHLHCYSRPVSLRHCVITVQAGAQVHVRLGVRERRSHAGGRWFPLFTTFVGCEGAACAVHKVDDPVCHVTGGTAIPSTSEQAGPRAADDNAAVARERTRSVSLIIDAVDAQHCAGSLSYLIEGPAATDGHGRRYLVLASGDMLANDKLTAALTAALAGRQLDEAVVDNTFASAALSASLRRRRRSRATRPSSLTTPSSPRRDTAPSVPSMFPARASVLREVASMVRRLAAEHASDAGSVATAPLLVVEAPTAGQEPVLATIVEALPTHLPPGRRAVAFPPSMSVLLSLCRSLWHTGQLAPSLKHCPFVDEPATGHACPAIVMVPHGYVARVTDPTRAGHAAEREVERKRGWTGVRRVKVSAQLTVLHDTLAAPAPSASSESTGGSLVGQRQPSGLSLSMSQNTVHVPFSSHSSLSQLTQLLRALRPAVTVGLHGPMASEAVHIDAAEEDGRTRGRQPVSVPVPVPQPRRGAEVGWVFESPARGGTVGGKRDRSPDTLRAIRALFGEH